MSVAAYRSPWERFSEGRKAAAWGFVLAATFALGAFLAFDALLVRDFLRHKTAIMLEHDTARLIVLLANCVVFLLVQTATVCAILRVFKSGNLPKRPALGSMLIVLVASPFAAVTLHELTKPDPTPIRVSF
ncbi:MAG: hypothetical protein ACOY7T_06690 [Pseudomonadota bacterium]